MSNWRYNVEHDAVNNHTTITRGRMYNLDNPDAWAHYWEGGEHVAFYNEGWRGRNVPDWADKEKSGRAIVAWDHERAGATRNSTGSLKRLAVRLTENPDADFICVGIDRGCDLYVLSWTGDPDGEWRDEIEAVSNGDIYRCEVERYEPDHETVWYASGPVTYDGWVTEDDVCEEWYGEDKADEALATMFPETEFPAELTVTSSD